MFDVQNVSLSFGERIVLNNAVFKVEDGERAAIIGPNGAGKSTLLKIVAGKLKPESGQVSIPKTHEIGYLPQDIELDSRLSVLEECKTVFADLLDHEREMRALEEQMVTVHHGEEGFDEIADRYEFLMHETQRRDLYSIDSVTGKVLSGLGFKPEDFDRLCNEFSGGWQMRICLAKLLLRNPDVLLLDEPTNHLDIETIQWLGEWIKGHDGCVLMVSHERAFMDALVTKVVEVERGNVIIYRGNYSEAQEKRAERRIMQRRTYENFVREVAHVQKFIDRFRYQASKAALVQSRIKQLEKIEKVEPPTDDQGTIHFRFPPASRSAKEVIVAEEISKAYGEKEVLHNIGVTVYRGDKVALVGVNGAGKTTLMRILAGRDPDHRGGVTIGSNVDMAYFAQYDKEDLHPENTVLGEFVSQAPLSVSEKARGILGAFLFSGDDVEKKIQVLSGGERTRLRLAKMLCGKANLLLLDEPTNHLDIGSRLTLEEALRQFDGCVVLVSHDRYFLDNVVTRVVEIDHGKVTSYQGNYTEYLMMKEMQEAKNGTAPASGKKKLAVDTNKLTDELRSVPKRENNDDRKRRQEDEKKAKNRLRKVEKEVEEQEELMYQIDELLRDLENQMASPEVTSDHGKLAELTAHLKQGQKRREEIEKKWMALSEEIESLNASVTA